MEEWLEVYVKWENKYWQWDQRQSVEGLVRANRSLFGAVGLRHLNNDIYFTTQVYKYCKNYRTDHALSKIKIGAYLYASLAPGPIGTTSSVPSCPILTE